MFLFGWYCGWYFLYPLKSWYSFRLDLAADLWFYVSNYVEYWTRFQCFRPRDVQQEPS